jgi:ribonuclease R
MLPHALSSGICSLVEGEDRLTQTAVMEIDAEGRVVEARFYDGVIRSAAKLAYRDAQAILDGDADARARFAHAVPTVELAAELGRVLNRARVLRGSLDFDLPEPELQLDPLGVIENITSNPRLFAMRMIEEFMLAANEAVARELSSRGVATLYRIHESPDPERLAEYVELVRTFGHDVSIDLENPQGRDFQTILKAASGRPEERLLTYLMLRTQRLARYAPENLGHFGLASPNYLHFTSPIRRYPDLVAHRALRALREGRDPLAVGWPLDDMAERGALRPLRSTRRHLCRGSRSRLHDGGRLLRLP